MPRKPSARHGRASPSVPLAILFRSAFSKLDQIPAADIESLEIINNPSAKYNPEGKSGIINIKMKQIKTAGFSGNAMFTAGTGDKYNESLNLNYNFGKINLFGSYSGMKKMAVASRYLLREAYDSDSVHFLQQDAKTNLDITKNSFTLGSNFNFNSQNKLTLSYAYNPSRQTDSDNTLSQYFDRSMNKTGSVFVINSENEKETSNDYLLAYRKLFDKKGEELTVDYTLSNSSASIHQPQTYQYATKTELAEITSGSDSYNSNLQMNWPSMKKCWPTCRRPGSAKTFSATPSGWDGWLGGCGCWFWLAHTKCIAKS